eukprot:CAMPEP_0119399446 /NCGR_PEP_ID=MMETSP1334-20130426/141361_1 /TAXON_ID=127549 /ORGANISM="Calcidiscus leptoporus, Strain RCC1130" /LENGTH=159 /DNA_ID=CAMNT_0007423339 /DNA_START=78 /DNA_END=557 /DNA_ORIENTATION=+
MTVNNPGADPLSFTTALHTYFRVHDVSGAKLLGLAGCSYDDNSLAGGGKNELQEEEHVTFTAEVDRVYGSTPTEAFIVDGERVVKVLKMGFADAVVWNIGADRADALKDLAAGEWKKYVCYEAAAINKPVKLAPNATWTAGQTFTRLTAAELPREECKA